MVSNAAGAPCTLNMVIAALGGEGGGVLTNWLIEAAEREDWYCQSTSLAGVAQRTGATIYYLEFIRRDHNMPAPVMSLFPAQGDIDVAVASEIAEAGRMSSRGFVSPDRTTLITSDHRVYGITEKSATTDGTINEAVLGDIATRYSARYIHFDMQEIVRRHNTVVSAALLGAIAGAAVLPFKMQTLRDIISQGRGGDANLAAFEESATIAANDGVAVIEPETLTAFSLPSATTEAGRRLLPRLAALPDILHPMLLECAERLVAYQDVDYAELWLKRVKLVAERDACASTHRLTAEYARYLALWMCFEDIPRVAQLKIRPDRFAEIRQEVKADEGQLLQVTEFFHPRIEEVAALLPERIGRALLASTFWNRQLSRLMGARKLRTDSLSVYFTLRFLASLRRMRRVTLGYAHENQMIEAWSAAVLSAAMSDSEAAIALAESGRMVKGYGDTRYRTTSRLLRIVSEFEDRTLTAKQIVALREAAMLDEAAAPFDAALGALGN